MILSKDQLKDTISSLNPFDNGRGQFIINCPKCSNRECGVSYIKQNHPFGCYRKSKCGATGNIYDLLKFLGIRVHWKKDVDVLHNDLQNISLNSLVKNEKLLSLPNRPLPLGYQRIYQNDYLDSRGWIDKDYQYWHVGKTSLLYSLKKYCIFPIYYHNEVKAYVARREVAGDPKYNNSSDDFSYLIGGFDKVTNNTHTAIICEGKLDIVNVNRLLDLYDCEQIKPLCTFGAKLSHDQISTLLQYNIINVILLWDNDVVDKIKPSAFELELYFNTQIATIHGNNDPGDCSFKQLNDALNNTLTPFEFFVNKL